MQSQTASSELQQSVCTHTDPEVWTRWVASISKFNIFLLSAVSYVISCLFARNKKDQYIWQYVPALGKSKMSLRNKSKSWHLPQCYPENFNLINYNRTQTLAKQINFLKASENSTTLFCCHNSQVSGKKVIYKEFSTFVKFLPFHYANTITIIVEN